jgi:putative DNA primase/helicase
MTAPTVYWDENGYRYQRDRTGAAVYLDQPPPNGNQPGARLTAQLASNVKVAPPVWHWRYWLVAAAVHLFTARQGTGKSTWAAWLVAQASTGRPWPGETVRRAPVPCGMLSLEEPGGERLAARLHAAGADLDAVHIFGHVEVREDGRMPYKRPWRLPDDCDALEAQIRQLRLAVVTIDGLGHSITGDSHNYAKVGQALSALADVAARTGCAIVGLTHPPKGNSAAATSAIGSTGWTALARLNWVMGFDPTDELPDLHPDKRRVVRPALGGNYRLPDHGLSFRISEYDELETGIVTDLRASDVDPQTITSPPVEDADDSDTMEATAVLEQILKPGPLWVKLAQDQMTVAGFTPKQTRTAKKNLNVRSEHFGKPHDPEQGWKWVLPGSEDARRTPEDAQGALSTEEGILGTLAPERASS